MKTKTIKYLSFVTVAAAAVFGIYCHNVLAKYEYWNQLIAQDPKPSGVSEQEYRDKLRSGYCWRDKKFYTAKELHQKAIVSFSGLLLGEAEAYRTDMTENQGGKAYTGADCARSETACRVWLMPQNYTNEQWDKWLLRQKDPTDDELLSRYYIKEIRQAADLKNHMIQHKNEGFSLIFRNYAGDQDVYGSDCCRVLNKQEAKNIIENNILISYIEGTSILPENKIPEGIEIGDYGVGNFYIEAKRVTPFLSNQKEETYQERFSRVFLMNNCGDILWLPYYNYQSK